jgi:Ca-activated chloride channel family protein
MQRVLPLLLAAVMASAGAAAAQPRVEVILDGSQEMWLPLDARRPRFVAARMALDSWLLERSGDDDFQLGLRLVSGGLPFIEHGGCDDTTLVFPPGPPDAAAWRAALDAVRPAGARPLLLAVAAAATDLGASEDPRRIVLVTGGEESCFGDERAAVAALASGVELRVVGVGLADDAVTRFGAVAATRNTTSTATLLAALRWAVEDLSPAAGGNAAVQIRLAGAQRDAAATLVNEITAERRDLTRSGDFVVGAVAPGVYALELAAPDGEVTRIDGIAVSAGDGLELDLELPPPFPTDLEVIPDRPLAGAPVFAGFGGVASGPYWVSLAAGDEPAPAWVDIASTVGPEDLVELRVPDEPGPLELRLHEPLAAGASRVVTRVSFKSIAPEVTLALPEEVRPFEPLPAAWTGPDHPGDHLSLVRAGGPSTAHASCSPTALGSPAALVAPGEEGAWEVRYLSGLEGRTLASASVTVTAIIVTLTAPSEIAAGRRFEVDWEGPAAPADFLALATEAAGDGDYLSLHLASKGSPARFVAPWELGSYEIRYVEGDGNRVRRRTTVSVVTTPVSLKAPRRVRAGTRFDLRWTGPNRPGDYLAVAVRGAGPLDHEDWAYTAAGSPASLAAPFAAGEYELRYVSGNTHEILAAIPITVN